MATTHTRVLGGGNTYVEIGLSKTVKVEFLAQIQDTPGGALAQPEQIHPIGSPYPVEIATAYGQQAGTIVLSVWSTWGRDGWVSAFMTTDASGVSQDTTGIWDKFKSENADNKGNQLDGYPVDLYEVLKAQRMNDGYIQVSKIEKGANGEDYRIKKYQGCVITNIEAPESIRNNTMTQEVRITMMYTNVTAVQY